MQPPNSNYWMHSKNMALKFPALLTICSVHSPLKMNTYIQIVSKPLPMINFNLCTCHFCTRLLLYISHILHKELSIAKWIPNVSTLRYMYTRVSVSAFFEKSCHMYLVSMGVIVVGPCHDKLLASGGYSDLAIFCNKDLYYVFFKRCFPTSPFSSCPIFSISASFSLFRSIPWCVK